MPLTTRSSLLDAAVAARAGVEGLNPARSVHVAAQVLGPGRVSVVNQISPLAPLTTTYSVVPITAQTGWSSAIPVGFLSQVAEKDPGEPAVNVLW